MWIHRIHLEFYVTPYFKPNLFSTMNSSIVRYRWVDIAKGFAILSVVLLHINYQFYDSKCLPLATLLGELWHVPVFFLLGGFFLKEERLLQPVSFIKGKIKSLYRLLLYFYIPAVLLHNVLLHLGFYSQSVSYGGKLVTVYSVGKTLKELLLAVCLAGREPILGAMWFVYVLFMALCGLSIISWIVNRIIKRNENKEWVRCLVLLCFCIISCALTNLFDFTIPRFNNTITAMWLIYCGYILKNRLKLQFCNKYVCVISLFAAYHIAIISGGVSLNSNKYNDVLVIAISSVGMERFRDCIIATLRELFPDCLIYERSESASREKEGLAPRAGLIAGDESALPEVLYVKEYGEVYLPVNVRSGHKTGGYLDQRQSRRYLKSLTHGRSVLNCFAYTGGFGLWALKGGASRVFNVDVSDLALRAAKEGVAFNHLDPGRCRVIKEDVFEFLRNEAASGNSYDVIVLDPPKFAESARTLKSACRGYQDINRLAFSLLKEGGDLLTFSCSGHMEPSLFQKIVADAALEAGVEAHIVSTLRQDRDHPVALSCPESFYLKGLHVRVSATGLPLPLKEEKNRPVNSETAESSKPAPRSRKGQRRTGPRH